MVSEQTISKIIQTLKSAHIHCNIMTREDTIEVACFREIPLSFKEKRMIRSYLSMIAQDLEIMLFFDPSENSKKSPMHHCAKGE